MIYNVSVRNLGIKCFNARVHLMQKGMPLDKFRKIVTLDIASKLVEQIDNQDDLDYLLPRVHKIYTKARRNAIRENLFPDVDFKPKVKDHEFQVVRI